MYQRHLNGNVNATSGISTFNRVSVSSTISSDSLIVDSGTLHSSANHKLSVNSSSSSRFFVSESGAIGISTNVDLDNYPTVEYFHQIILEFLVELVSEPRQ